MKLADLQMAAVTGGEALKARQLLAKPIGERKKLSLAQLDEPL